MKKELSVKDLGLMLQEVVGVRFEYELIGDLFNQIEKYSRHLFSEFDGYYDYKEFAEGESSIEVQCNREAAIKLHNHYVKSGYEHDFELFIDNEFVSEDVDALFDNSNIIILNGINDIVYTLEIISDIAKTTQSEMEFKFEDSAYDDFSFEAHIKSDGSFESLGSGIITSSNKDEFLFTSMRILSHFMNSKPQDLEKIHFTLLLDGTFKSEPNNMCGREIINRYIDNKEPLLFIDLESTKKMIKQYPIVMTIAPNQFWNNKELVLEFLTSNNRFYNELYNAFHDSTTKANQDIVSSRIVKHDKKLIYQNAVIDIFPKPLKIWLNDEDIFDLILMSPMVSFMSFDPSIFDEEFILKKLVNNPLLINAIFDYYFNYILDNKKLAEHLKRKYRLREDVDKEVLAGCQCYEMTLNIKNPINHLKILSMQSSSSSFLHIIFKCFNKSIQEALIRYNLSFIQYIKNDLDPYNPLVEMVIQMCPYPGAFLSDETILIRKLDVYHGDLMKLCNECRECEMLHVKTL